jgi:hypothetical protein
MAALRFPPNCPPSATFKDELANDFQIVLLRPERSSDRLCHYKIKFDFRLSLLVRTLVPLIFPPARWKRRQTALITHWTHRKV